MRNRTFTALLIILATTGVEAQTYQSALKLALGGISVEDMAVQPEVRALKSDILSAIKALRQLEEKDKQYPPLCKTYGFTCLNISFSSPKHIVLQAQTHHLDNYRNPALGKGIRIRAPACMLIN